MATLDYQYIGTLVADVIDNDDSNSFAELYASTYQHLYRFAYNYLKNEYLAQDALQDTFILVYKNLKNLKNPDLFIAWLNQIAFRVCFNMSRKYDRYRSELDIDDDVLKQVINPDENPESQVIKIDEREYIVRQVLNLPFTESQCIIMRYYQNMNIQDIASLMDISVSSVKRYLNSGRKRLKQILDY